MIPFASLDAEGKLTHLNCKICGTTIGKMETVNGRSVFIRLSNYLEVKIRCDDGSFHVTNGCAKCLKNNLSLDTASALLRRDGLFDAGLNTKRKPVEIVAFGVGIP